MSTTPETEVDDLDNLLSESLVIRDELREVQAIRERLKRKHSGSGRTPQEVAEDEARVREWELRNDWEATANVALFERHRCNGCRRQQTIFRQLMLRQVHRTLADTTRWQQVNETVAELPYEIQVQKWESPMCTNCSDAFGFDFKTCDVGEWAS